MEPLARASRWKRASIPPPRASAVGAITFTASVRPVVRCRAS